MAKKPVFSYFNVTKKKRGKAFIGGIQKMLLTGDRVTIQKVKDRLNPYDRIVKRAMKYVGVVETPANSNSGYWVKQFQQATTVNGTGWPWCQGFVRFVLSAEKIDMHGYFGAYVPSYVAHAKQAKKWTQTPKKGYRIVFDFNGDGVADHVGIVSEVHTGFVETIEGNTSKDNFGSQSNGGGVFIRKRTSHTILGYIKN